MASSSSKRIKTVASKTDRGQKRKEQIYSNKFLSHMHEGHFQIVQNRRLLMERKVGLIPTMAPEFERELGRRQWDSLASYPSPANIAVVKEFYTNARTFGGANHEMYASYVRGKRIPFDDATINSFLGTIWIGIPMPSPQPPRRHRGAPQQAHMWTSWPMLHGLQIQLKLVEKLEAMEEDVDSNDNKVSRSLSFWCMFDSSMCPFHWKPARSRSLFVPLALRAFLHRRSLPALVSARVSQHLLMAAGYDLLGSIY
ncbi:hypothetical protein LR48_Vigan07g188400 [Vigna angularis]|uniref:Putative plant transposon protein domain-containing protein n=1 Tax=Phaseolus angularis TaxID=3914 RepID=A0A0L9UZ92_PHAAN|nr:hypothetical protein LR48_Vigan07g188400 [Vigna angularis]